MPYHTFNLGGAQRLQACEVDKGQSYGNIKDSWRFLPADQRTWIDAPAITCRLLSWCASALVKVDS